jgi:hypothetical protein
VGRPFFVDSDTGWVLARYPSARTALYHTGDGGQRWDLVLDVAGAPSPGRAISGADDVLDLAFRPDGTGWLTGGAGSGTPALFVTHDGGRAWTREALPLGGDGPGAGDRLQIGAPTVSPGGRGGLPVYDRDRDRTWLYATDDGGATWGDPRPLPGGDGNRRPVFVDGIAGWTATTEGAWVTPNAGRTWLPAAGLSAGWLFGAVAPVSQSLAWVTAVKLSQAGAGGGPTRWSLFRTSDAGQHWTQARLPGLG